MIFFTTKGTNFSTKGTNLTAKFAKIFARFAKEIFETKVSFDFMTLDFRLFYSSKLRLQ